MSTTVRRGLVDLSPIDSSIETKSKMWKRKTNLLQLQKTGSRMYEAVKIQVERPDNVE